MKIVTDLQAVKELANKHGWSYRDAAAVVREDSKLEILEKLKSRLEAAKAIGDVFEIADVLSETLELLTDFEVREHSF